MSDPTHQEPPGFVRAWMTHEPGRLIGRGHPAGDFLEAYDWHLLEESEGFLSIRAYLPAQVKNPRGQLFGGFTPTYVDLIAVLTVRTGGGRKAPGFRTWLTTTSMHVDYFEPIVGPEFLIESRLVKSRGRARFVETRFFDPRDTLAVVATTMMRELRPNRPLGDE